MVVASFISVALIAQGDPGQWTTYGANLGSQRYSSLDQINKDNFAKLQIAWRFKTNNLGPSPDGLYSSTPLMVNGVLYTTAGTRRPVIALNPGTGEHDKQYIVLAVTGTGANAGGEILAYALP